MSDAQAPSRKKTHTACHRARTLRRFCRSVFKRDKGGVHQSDFNPEEQFNQKKEWLKHRTIQDKRLRWPENCFEHLVIVGLPHTTDIQEVIRSIKKENAKTTSRNSSDASSASVKSEKPNHNPPKPVYDPQLLYQFPEDKPLHMTPEELVSFCFPHGVTPRLLRRSASMSALNEVVYGQQHFVHSDQSFVFLHRGGDGLPMFGVCYLVNQMLHTPPGLVKHKFRENGVSPSKHMVAAPRCYCLLSRYPFFELHFQVLNLVLGLERLDSISDYMNEIMKLPTNSSLFNCLGSKSSNQLRALTPDPCAIRAFSASPTPPAMLQSFSRRGVELGSDISSRTVNIASDGESQQTSNETPVTARDSFSSSIPINDILQANCCSQNRTPRHGVHCRSISGHSFREGEINDAPLCFPRFFAALGVADSAYLPSDLRAFSTSPGSSHRYTDSCDSEFFCPSVSMPDLSTLLFQDKIRTQSDPFLFDKTPKINSLNSNLGDVFRFHSTKATCAWSEDPGEIMPACQKLLCHFRSLRVPDPGETITFVPEESGLQRIEYKRPQTRREWKVPQLSGLWTERAFVEEETAFGLKSWTVVVLCRSLSLENILSLLAGAMLERQIVFFCSNIGVLTSAVLALIPLLRPFAWQSLILPTLPACYLEFLEAPVPFALGIQHKTPEVAQRSTGLMRVNLYKDKIKNAPMASCLPGYKSLHSDLLPWHKKLQESSKYSRRPSHVVTSSEYIAVEAFLNVMRGYLTGLVKELERHTITDVTSQDGVSLLLEESFIESFSQKDQSFMKAFSQTQMFMSFVDSVIGK